MISIHNLITLFLSFCGGIGILGAAVAYIAKAIGWIRLPEKHQDETLADHEKRISELERKTDSDYDDIKKLNREVKMVLQAIVAIMKHELDGNHQSDLIKAQADIEKYLLEK